MISPELHAQIRRLFYAEHWRLNTIAAQLGPHHDTVRRAVERWEPRIEILSLDATRHPEAPERLLIVLEYRVRATRRTGQLAYPVDLTGENR